MNRPVTKVLIAPKNIKIKLDLLNIPDNLVSILDHVTYRHHGPLKIDMLPTFRDDHHILLSFQILQLLQYPQFLFFTLLEFLFQLDVQVLLATELIFEIFVDDLGYVAIVCGT